MVVATSVFTVLLSPYEASAVLNDQDHVILLLLSSGLTYLAMHYIIHANVIHRCLITGS